MWVSLRFFSVFLLILASLPYSKIMLYYIIDNKNKMNRRIILLARQGEHYISAVFFL